jgi:hypothetical protein
MLMNNLGECQVLPGLLHRVAQWYISKKIFFTGVLISLSSTGGYVAHMGRIESVKWQNHERQLERLRYM